jgi:polysaccharide biosynthesis/export protein
MKPRIGLVIALLLAQRSTPVWAQDNAKPNDKAAVAAPDTPPGTPASSPATYVIGADDTLHIDVWKEPDLTATLPVRPDGMISLPLLNDVPAAGLTPMQLSASITEKLKKYLADPRVTVVVTQMSSQRIFVTGEVLHSGAMALLPDMNVLQALASAGLNQFAKTKGIYILRSDKHKQTKIPVNYRQLLKGAGITPNILLKPGDTIVVP